MFLVKIGTLTIVARTPKEAIRIHSELLDYDGAADVTITDMNGYALDLEDVVRQSEEYDRL